MAKANTTAATQVHPRNNTMQHFTNQPHEDPSMVRMVGYTTAHPFAIKKTLTPLGNRQSTNQTIADAFDLEDVQIRSRTGDNAVHITSHKDQAHHNEYKLAHICNLLNNIHAQARLDNHHEHLHNLLNNTRFLLLTKATNRKVEYPRHYNPKDYNRYYVSCNGFHSPETINFQIHTGTHENFITAYLNHPHFPQWLSKLKSTILDKVQDAILQSPGPYNFALIFTSPHGRHRCVSAGEILQCMLSLYNNDTPTAKHPIDLELYHLSPNDDVAINTPHCLGPQFKGGCDQCSGHLSKQLINRLQLTWLCA
jgi:hypothetical protein